MVAKAISLLANQTAKESECTNVDALRFKKYFGYMLKEGRTKTIEEMQKKCLCVIEHLFNTHTYCDPRWCVPSRMNLPMSQDTSSPPAQTVRKENSLPPTHQISSPTDNNVRTGAAKQSYHRWKRRDRQVFRHRATVSKSFYRCKKRNRRLYEQMWKVYEPYITKERLLKSLHPFHTETNEVLNRLIAMYAPKDRTYSSTMSLSNHIAIAILVFTMMAT